MSNRCEDSSVEEYLERLRGLLIGLPKEEIDGAIEEMGPHLRALVDAERDAGVAEDEAVRNAIARFGNPKVIARKIAMGFLEERMQIVESQRSKQANLRTAAFWISLVLVMFGLPSLLQEANRAIGLQGVSELVASFGVLGLFAGIFSGLHVFTAAHHEFGKLLESAPELKEMTLARLRDPELTKAAHPWARGAWCQRWALRLAQPRLDKWKDAAIASINQAEKPRKPRINPLFIACWLVWLGVLAFLPIPDRSILVTDTAFFLAMSVGDWFGQWIGYAFSLKRTYGS